MSGPINGVIDRNALFAGMEISKQSEQVLVLEQKNGLGRIIPLAIGLAGLLLTLGMMREYGVQSWYRTPYWLGAVIAAAGLLIFITIPFSVHAKLDRKAGKLILQSKRGFRTESYQSFPLAEVKSVRVEQANFSRQGGPEESRYRVAVQIFDEWVPLSPKFRRELYPHQQAAGQIQAFLQAGG